MRQDRLLRDVLRLVRITGATADTRLSRGSMTCDELGEGDTVSPLRAFHEKRIGG